MNKDFFQKHRQSIIVSGSIVIALLLIYFIGFWFFQTRFVPNTKIGAIKISQLSKSAAQERIQVELESYELTIAENEQTLGFIHLNQLDIATETDSLLEQLLADQSPAKWPLHLLVGPKHEVELNDAVTLSETTMSGLLHTIGIDNNNRPEAKDAFIALNDEGVYQLQDETYGQQVSVASLEQAILNKLEEGAHQLELSEAYILPEVNKENQQLLALQTKLDQMQNVSITLNLEGENVTVPKDIIASWIIVENQEPSVDTALVEDYILELNKQYSGLFKQREFESTYQGTVVLDPGTYGWYIDRFAEAEAITNDILAVRDVEREPIIEGTGYGLEDDIGSSYVEVDIYNQMMTIYYEGDIVLQTAVVTGTPGTNTVPGAYQVWNKEYDTTLLGYNPNTEMDYEQPVDYWIAFDDQAQGIHDANWQNSFGGDAYLTNGSLGCINTPPGIMPQVFELVYHGMPVVIF